MSIILDALRKSDAARPAAGQQRLAPAPLRRRGPPGWLWLLLGVAMIAVGSAALTTYLAAPPARTGGQQRIMENGRGNGPGNAPSDDIGPATIRPLAEIARERSVAATTEQENAPETTATPAPVPAETESSTAAQDLENEASALVAPWLKDMPAEFRINVPNLTINALAYADDPAERFVLINLRRYAEGDRLQEGPRLLQIQAGAVILEYRNREFAIPAR